MALELTGIEKKLASHKAGMYQPKMDRKGISAVQSTRFGWQIVHGVESIGVTATATIYPKQRVFIERNLY